MASIQPTASPLEINTASIPPQEKSALPTQPQEPLEDGIYQKDRGYAWIIMIACFLNLGFSLGAVNSIGIFQTYYLKVMFVNVPAETIAWISTTSVTVSLSCGLVSTTIADRIGLRNTALLASFFGSLGLLLASFSSKVWQLVLTQGFIFGFGSSLLINLSFAVPSQWFDKHKSFAMGLIASGGGFGALILIPVLSKMIEVSTFGWAFRVLFIVYAVITGSSSFLVKPRIATKQVRPPFDLKILKEPIIIWLCLIGFFVQIGTSVVILYFPASVVDLGYNATIATNLIMVFSVFSASSRLASGYLSKKIDAVNILIVVNLISTIIFMAIWYNSKSFGRSLTFYILFGIVGVPYFALQPIIVSSNYHYQQVAIINGFIYLIMGISILIAVPSIGKVFQTVGKRHDYRQIIIISTVSFFLATLSSIGLKYCLVKKQKSKLNLQQTQTQTQTPESHSTTVSTIATKQ